MHIPFHGGGGGLVVSGAWFPFVVCTSVQTVSKFKNFSIRLHMRASALKKFQNIFCFRLHAVQTDPKNLDSKNRQNFVVLFVCTRVRTNFGQFWEVKKSCVHPHTCADEFITFHPICTACRRDMSSASSAHVCGWTVNFRVSMKFSQSRAVCARVQTIPLSPNLPKSGKNSLNSSASIFYNKT